MKDQKIHSALAPHQKRVLAAMLAMSQRRGQHWWARSEIGEVVGAGGFHQTIQRSTMHRLRAMELVLTERESWSEEVRLACRCNCACYRWGLTPYGWDVACELNVRITSEAEARIERVLALDHREPRGRGELDDDDDDDPAEAWKRG